MTDRYRIGKTFISITTPLDTQKRIKKAIDDGLNTYICVSIPRTINLASYDAKYREVMNNSFMNTPDGEPTLWAARLWGLKTVERTMGPVLFENMITNPESGIRHFLLGDTDETLSNICEKAKEYNALIVGTYSPPFCKLEEYDYKGIAKMINDSGANIVWVAMRAPKQDFFAVNILPYLDRKICIGVGAAFRFFIGEYKMAPPLIRKLGLMGLYWGRKGRSFGKFLWDYFRHNVPFLWHLIIIPLRRLVGKRYYE
jgi:N-acetylglucosaminyldiphosphoundecaprenol N-acetyl-beta-D-mannosaminyltransferase